MKDGSFQLRGDAVSDIENDEKKISRRGIFGL